jgi:hypothetical protein
MFTFLFDPNAEAPNAVIVIATFLGISLMIITAHLLMRVWGDAKLRGLEELAVQTGAIILTVIIVITLYIASFPRG